MLFAEIDVNMLLDAIIFSGPAWIAAFLGWRNSRAIKIPSGGKIGEMMERTHAQSAVSAAGVKVIADAITNGDPNITPHIASVKPEE